MNPDRLAPGLALPFESSLQSFRPSKHGMAGFLHSFPWTISLERLFGRSEAEVDQGNRQQATGISKKDLVPETCSLKSPSKRLILLEYRQKERPDTL
jgi:hypothetical protein